MRAATKLIRSVTSSPSTLSPLVGGALHDVTGRKVVMPVTAATATPPSSSSSTIIHQRTFLDYQKPMSEVDQQVKQRESTTTKAFQPKQQLGSTEVAPSSAATATVSSDKPLVLPKEETSVASKQKDVDVAAKGTSSSEVVASKPQTTSLIGNSGEKIVVGDDFIQITYENKNIDTGAGGSKSDVGNIVVDGEASTTLAEATSEIAAVASDATTRLPLSASGKPLLANLSDIPSNLNDEEKSLLQRMVTLNKEVDEKVIAMEKLTKKLADHIIRLVSLSWNTNRAPTMVSFPMSWFGFPEFDELERTSNMMNKYSLATSAQAARTMSDKMESEAKSTRECLAKYLQEVSTFTGSSNEIIRQRGEEFKLKLETLAKTCDGIMNRSKHAADAFAHFLHRRLPLQSMDQVTKPVDKESKQAPSITSSAEDTKRAVTETKVAPSDKPGQKVRVRWSPDFLSRELLDGVLISSTLPGLTADNLEIHVDEKNRILHIAGQRTIKQRVIDHEATAAKAASQQPDEDIDYNDFFDLGFRSFFGRSRRLVPQQAVTKLVEVEKWFDEKLEIPPWLSTNVDKYRTSIDPKTGYFSIAIPKVSEEPGQRAAGSGFQTIRVKRQDSPATSAAASPAQMEEPSDTTMTQLDDNTVQQRRPAKRSRSETASPVWSYYGIDDPFFDEPMFMGGGGYRGIAPFWAFNSPFNTPSGFGW